MSLLNAESRAPPERWRGTGLSGVDQEACRGIALPRHLNGVFPKALSCAICSSLFMLLRGSQLLLWLKNNLMTLYFHTESLTRDHPSISSILRSFHMSVFVGSPKGTKWSRHLNKWEEFQGAGLGIWVVAMLSSQVGDMGWAITTDGRWSHWLLGIIWEECVEWEVGTRVRTGEAWEEAEQEGGQERAGHRRAECSASPVFPGGHG